MGISSIISTSLLLSLLVMGSSFSPVVREAVPQLSNLHESVLDVWELVRPGGQFHPSSFIEHKGHLLVEGLLVAVIIYLLFQSSYKPSKRMQKEKPLTEQVAGAGAGG